MMSNRTRNNAMYENYKEIKLSKDEMEIMEVTPHRRLHKGKMTFAEQKWAEAFEELQYAEQRGKGAEAKQFFETLTGREPNEQDISKINANIQIAISSNPTRAEAKAKNDVKRGHNRNIRKRKSNMYGAIDFQMHKGFKWDEDEGEMVEQGICINPTDVMDEAIDEARSKNRSLEKLIIDVKLSKEAKADLLAKTQLMTYEAMTYTFHGTQYMNLNYILRAPNGQLFVQDQHDRIQTLALYLKRHTADSFATHAEVYYPGLSKPEIWIFKPGHRSDVEGKAVQYEGV